MKDSNWMQKDNKLTKEFEFKDFVAAVRFIDQVAEAAQALDHHPDISLHSYNKVSISTSTHAEGRVTEKDRELADAIDSLER